MTINENDKPRIKQLILAGGANSHLMHIFEDGDLTFRALYDIFVKVFSGKIELREKVDGFAFTVTMRDGVLYSARNKTELKSPLTFDQTVQKFSDRPAIVRNAFITSFTDMNTALQALSRKEQNDIFGKGKYFLSFEIVSPGAKNIVSYGSKAVIIMHGINIFNDEWEKVSDDPEKAKKLYDYFEKHNVLNQNTFEIQGPVVLKIKNATKASEALSELKADITDILDGIPMSTRLLDYVIAKIQPKLQDIAVKSGVGRIMTDVVVSDLISRSGNKLGLKQVAVTDVIAHIADNTFDSVSKGKIKTFITAINDDVNSLVNQAVMPVWVLVVKAGTLLIKCLTGFVAADNDEAVKALSNQLNDVVNSDFKTHLSPGNMERFTNTLERLDKFNREILGTEGVVFTYNNKLYKLTSTFGPLNQLLGLFYRAQPGQRQEPAEESITTEADDDTTVGEIPTITQTLNKNVKYVVYIPGSFKPPHLGHINMIRAYANRDFGISTQVKVIMSEPNKAKRLLSTGQEITAGFAANALTFILYKLGILNVEIIIDNNPPKYIFKDITENPDLFKNTAVVIGMSSKDGMHKYDSLIDSIIKYMYDNDLNQNVREATLFIDPSITTIEPIANSDGTINAGDMRKVLSTIVTSDLSNEQIIKQLKPFLPRTLSDVDILTYFNYLQLK